MSISFNLIPGNIRTPGQFIEFDNSRAVQNPPAKPHKILVTGIMATGGVSGLPEVVYKIDSVDQAIDLFGPDFMITHMVDAAKLNDKLTEMFAVGLEAPAGTPAAFTLTFTGPATAGGRIVLYTGGRRFEFPVTSGDSETVIAAAVGALDTTDLPFDFVPVAGVVTATMKWDGESGSDYDFRFNHQKNEFLPAGVTAVVAESVPGVGAADIQDVIDAIGAVQYDTIISGFNDTGNLTTLDTELRLRWGPTVQQEGHAFHGIVDTSANLTTFGNALNSEFLTFVEVGGAIATEGSPTPPWEIAAAVGAIDAFQTTIDPARPRQTLQVLGVVAPKEEHAFTREERNTLLFDGIATTKQDQAGSVFIERLITTYQTKNAIPDPSFLDVVVMRTLALLRFEVRALFALKYPRHKLAKDGTRFDAGQAVITPSVAKGELFTLFAGPGGWEARGLVEDFAQFKDELIVEINSTDPNRLDMQLGPNLINQFRVLAGQIQFLL